MAPPTPHLEKLNSALANNKLPAGDSARINLCIERYGQWVKDLSEVDGTPEQVVTKSVSLLNDYANHVYLDLIFDSVDDFLYRQKGQMKLDNSIIEEFLPWLARAKVMPELADDLMVGPTTCYAAVYFDSTVSQAVPGAGMHVRSKDQDFAISRRLFIKASHNRDFGQSADTDVYIAYVATEIKTNLDKTMFQEACATARDLRIAVPAAKYFLMTEWLDMVPVSTAPTDVEEVLLLRKGRRLSANIRENFSSAARRKDFRQQYAEFLGRHPFRADVFQRWVNHVRALLADKVPVENHVLEQGYF
jgi:hypothetical protein